MMEIISNSAIAFGFPRIREGNENVMKSTETERVQKHRENAVQFSVSVLLNETILVQNVIATINIKSHRTHQF